MICRAKALALETEWSPRQTRFVKVHKCQSQVCLVKVQSLKMFISIITLQTKLETMAIQESLSSHSDIMLIRDDRAYEFRKVRLILKLSTPQTPSASNFCSYLHSVVVIPCRTTVFKFWERNNDREEYRAQPCWNSISSRYAEISRPVSWICFVFGS